MAPQRLGLACLRDDARFGFEDVREDAESLIAEFELECEMASLYDQLPCPRIQHIGHESMAYILAVIA